MYYILIGFAFGFIIPYMARRFAKFMPATFPYALYRLIHINKQVSYAKKRNNRKYINLRNRYFMRSLGWAIITSAITFFIAQSLPISETPWILTFIFILFALTEIDKRIFMLPDLLTVPLLIIGFAYASFAGLILADDTVSAVANSSLGAAAGYIIPVLAALCIIRKHPEAFGGGDIKLLAAVGAWLGIANIPYVILLSCIVFAVTCFINKERQGAFGPAIVISALIILFLSIP